MSVFLYGMASTFHSRCGRRVILTNSNKTAVRNFSEFNYGLVFSSKPLVDDQLYQVRIDKKEKGTTGDHNCCTHGSTSNLVIFSWSGNIQIGVTECDPETLELPSSASELRGGSWILSGTSVLKDGQPILDMYGEDLEKLSEGDCVGVMKTSEGELIFYINEEFQGIAARNLPGKVYAVVDMYGKCAQVTVIEDDEHTQDESDRSDSDEVSNEQPVLMADLVVSMNVDNVTTVTSTIPPIVQSSTTQSEEETVASVVATDKLKFHERCGSLVKLSCGGRSAERRRPLDEFNNGVVMTHRPLMDNELFEIRIDRLVEKWSGSIEVGVTTHNPNALEFPATMTNMRSGTTMMSGSGILTNGKGTRREYGEFNLDELWEGDRIGMMRKSNGNLHYFINGLDQGIAATKLPTCIWGVVDLYGMTVKVSIVDRDEREEQNLITRRNTTLRDQQMIHSLNEVPEEDNVDRLMFHANCGTHAAVINNNRTAHRPHALDDFNNGVVLTSRPLRPGELFEVRLDKMVSKWAGSIEIGVTTHCPTELEYPSTMTNVRSGTWMMTGNGVMHNGMTVIDEYGQNLDRLQVGDRVGVMRTEGGTLHFFVNGSDQGAAATNVPERVYGVIDLYGQAAQATVIDPVLDRLCQSSSDTASLSNMAATAACSDLRFHHLHGKNARISKAGLTASRPRAYGEFNDAVVLSNRALRDGELFEFIIEKTVDSWLGSVEAGVTTIRPDELELPCTMTEMTRGTWMLSGSSVTKDGVTLRKDYPCNLDEVTTGNCIGIMRFADGSLHFYLDGVDQGLACSGVASHVYAVVDLYGQCAQVSITQQPGGNGDSIAMMDDWRQQQQNVAVNVGSETLPANSQAPPDTCHRFGSCCGKNITLHQDGTVATRSRGYSHALCLGSAPLEADEFFEVVIREIAPQWSGTLRVGVTTLAAHGGELPTQGGLPQSGLPGLGADTWYIVRNELHRNGRMIHTNYGPSLEWLGVWDRVGVKRSSDGSLSFSLNGEDMGVAVDYVPKKVYPVIDLYGKVISVGVTSVSGLNLLDGTQMDHAAGAVATACAGEESLRSSRLHDSLEMLLDAATPTIASSVSILQTSSRKAPLEPTSEADTAEESKSFECITSQRQNIESAIEITEPTAGCSKSNCQSNSVIQEENKTDNSKISKIIEQFKEIPEAPLLFNEKRGRNIELTCSGCRASRTSSYNQGVVISGRPLCRDTIFQVKIESLNPRWVSSLKIGVTGMSPTDAHFPVTALGFRKDTWIVSGDFVLRNGIPLREKYGPNLDNLNVGDIVGVSVDSGSRLHLHVNGQDQGIAAQDLPSECYALVDIYGQCEQIKLVTGDSTDADDIVTNSRHEPISTLPIQQPLGIYQEPSKCLENLSEKADLECGEKEKSTGAVEKRRESAKDIVDSGLGVSDQMCSFSGSLSSLPPANTHSTTISTNDISYTQMKQNGAAPNLVGKNSVPTTPVSENKSENQIKEGITVETMQITVTSNDVSPRKVTPASSPAGFGTPTSPIKAMNHSASQMRKCDYHNMCLRFKVMLGLPDGFFLPGEQSTCFCNLCCQKIYPSSPSELGPSSNLHHLLHHHQQLQTGKSSTPGTPVDVPSINVPDSGGGTTVNLSELPVGWCCFPLRRHPSSKVDSEATLTEETQTSSSSMRECWHVAFYGVRLGDVRRILDHGELLLPGELGLERRRHKSKENDSEQSQIVFSPKLKHAVCNTLKTKKRSMFVDPKTKNRYCAFAAFQILVQPGSYKATGARIGKVEATSLGGAEEWVTKERGTTVLSALLLKLTSEEEQLRA